jgi:hypothetical protein
MATKFLKRAIQRPGRVHRYLIKEYGGEAFRKDGTIKEEYLNRAKGRAELDGNKSLVDAIDLAITLKTKWQKKHRRQRVMV